jgi:hypothetical protein
MNRRMKKHIGARRFWNRGLTFSFHLLVRLMLWPARKTDPLERFPLDKRPRIP